MNEEHGWVVVAILILFLLFLAVVCGGGVASLGALLAK